ncbi:MAG TPA: hypothetical protein VF608_14450 [Thermoanaerobaculia bacterium]
MKRLSFLPLFFIGLSVVFGATVWIRVASFNGQPAELRQTAELNDTRDRDRRVLSDGTTPIGSEGTIEAYPDENGSPGRLRGSSARQQRYNELLRTAPPAAAQQPKEQSLLDRMVAPIANAFGMNRAKPATAPQPREQQQPRQSGRGDQQQPNDRNQNPEPKRDPQEEQDPDTDVTPPTLTSAEFIPSQVHDGEETTLSVFVSDNLSGVRGVSGVVANPTGGALQGFSCRAEGNGRYVARIVVPKDAAEGTWSVKYLTLSDNASNSVNLNAAQGTLPQSASFRVVSSNSDSSGPKLKDVRIDRMAMRAGERNNVFVEAEDEKSGVAQVSGVFVSPSKSARLGFGCRAGAGGLWECPVSPPSCLDCGLWSLEQIQLQDKANNMSTFRMDNPAVAQIKLNIDGESCDSAPPTLQSLILNPPVISNLDGGTIRIEAILSDDGCGVASLSGQAIPPGGIGGQRAYFSFEPSPDGRTFVGTIQIAKHSAKGVWTIAWLQALDKGHNLRAYQTSDPVISRVTFRVE